MRSPVRRGRLLALCILATSLRAQRAPSLHDWMSLAAADAPAVAPDGRTVAYIVATPDWAKNDVIRQIWIVGSDGRGRRQITTDGVSSWNPRWSPDGTWLAFQSARQGATQVYVVAATGGDAAPLTDAENGVDDYRWSPNGRAVAYLSSERVAAAKPEPNEFHTVDNDAKYSAALWVVDVSAWPGRPGAGVRITDPNAFVADDIAWAPDSKRIAMHANRWDAPYPFQTYDIYVVDVESTRVDRVTDSPGPDFWPVWSPDGREIAYRTYVSAPGEHYEPHSQGYLAIVPAAGGARRLVSERFDEMTTPLAWTTDGLYFAARERTYQHLYRVDPKTNAIRRITQPTEQAATGFSFASDGRTVAFMSGDARRYPELFVASTSGDWSPRSLTTMGDQLRGWTVGRREVVSWKSRDGLDIEGVLISPPHVDPSRRYPLVVIVHGGPQAVDQPVIVRDFPYVAEAYAQRGFYVLRPNYRGSIGYGKAFRESLARNYGVKEYEDVVAGVDLLVRRGLVDSARVGLMGWSHGGYIAAFSATYGDRFAAVSVGAGVSDFRLFYSLGAGADLEPSAANPTPWDEPELFTRSSALTYAKRARTPTLIQHGERDPTAPIAGARELYRALKDQGVPTRMIIYTGAGHLPNGLRQFEIAARHNLDWFTEWLKP